MLEIPNLAILGGQKIPILVIMEALNFDLLETSTFERAKGYQLWIGENGNSVCPGLYRVPILNSFS